MRALAVVGDGFVAERHEEACFPAEDQSVVKEILVDLARRLKRPVTHTARMMMPPEFDGSELQRIRRSLDLSVAEVARLASVTEGQLRFLEEGSATFGYRPSVHVRESICAALHFYIMRRIKHGEAVSPERRVRQR